MTAKRCYHVYRGRPTSKQKFPVGRDAQPLLFDCVDDPEPSRVIDLDPRINRSYQYWHAFVLGVTAGQLCGYRVAGPFDPARGLRFDPNKVCSTFTGSASPGRRGEAAKRRGNPATTQLRRWRAG